MAETASHIVMGGKKPGKKRVLLSIGLAILIAAVAAGVGAGARWWQHQGESDSSAKPVAVAKEASEAQNLTLLGDFDKAHQTLDEALASPGLSKDDKYDLLLQKGLTYENQKEYDKAIASYGQAKSAKDTMDVNQSIARVAEYKGDKDLAIEYYKKAIPLVPEDDPRKEAIKRYLEDSIVRLGGQP